jgi:hypothetical protein
MTDDSKTKIRTVYVPNIYTESYRFVNQLRYIIVGCHFMLRGQV